MNFYSTFTIIQYQSLSKVSLNVSIICSFLVFKKINIKIKNIFIRVLVVSILFSAKSLKHILVLFCLDGRIIHWTGLENFVEEIWTGITGVTLSIFGNRILGNLDNTF